MVREERRQCRIDETLSRSVRPSHPRVCAPVTWCTCPSSVAGLWCESTQAQALRCFVQAPVQQPSHAPRHLASHPYTLGPAHKASPKNPYRSPRPDSLPPPIQPRTGLGFPRCLASVSLRRTRAGQGSSWEFPWPCAPALTPATVLCLSLT